MLKLSGRPGVKNEYDGQYNLQNVMRQSLVVRYTWPHTWYYLLDAYQLYCH